MKKIICCLILGFILTVSNAFARTCEEVVYDICIRQECLSSDASRGGVSKEEFCSAVAVSECTIGES